MSENIENLTQSNFSKKLERGVFLVDFFAQWCGPCKMLAPVLAEVSEEMQGKAYFGKVDIDKEIELASDYKVTSVPTLILFKNGKEVDRVVGLRDSEALKDFIEKAL